MTKNDYSYGWGKLYCAVLCLTGIGNQRDRLYNALIALHPLIFRPEEKHLPKEIQADFVKFWQEMTSVKAIGKEGDIRATVNSLDEMKIGQAIEKIISFYDTVCRCQKP